MKLINKEIKMKKMILTTAMIFGVMTISAEAGCRPSVRGGGVCTDAKGFYRLLPYSSGVLVNTYGNEKALKCTPYGGGVYVLLPKTHPNYKAVYSTILGATLAKRTISLAVIRNKSGYCQIAYAYTTK